MFQHRPLLGLIAGSVAAASISISLPSNAADAGASRSSAWKQISALPSAVVSNPVHEAHGQIVPPQNDRFTPIALPPGSSLRGLCLSGQAVVNQTDAAGSGRFAGKRISWKGRYVLTSGCALFKAEQSAFIECGPGITYVERLTTCVAHTDGPTTRLVNLSDRHRQSMRVYFAGHYVDLDPGVELVFVRSANTDAKSIAVQESIGWKEMRHEYIDGLHVFVFRVSAADMLKTCRIYRQLNESTLPVDHQLRDELVKTVAALEQMYNRRQGPFNVDSPYGYGPEGKTKEALRSGNPV